MSFGNNKPIVSKFRNEQNQRYSKQLFYELQIRLAEEKRSVEPIFSLHEDKPGLINFRKEYIKDEDPTGYTTANRLLENYDHWLYLMNSPWFVTAKIEWDKELDAKLQARAFKKIAELALGEDAKALQAAKFLANMEYKPKNHKRGRPTKVVEEEPENKKEFLSDLERIRSVT